MKLFSIRQTNRSAFSNLRPLEKTCEPSAGTASPTAPALLLEPDLGFPDQAPKLWLIASFSAMSSTIGIVWNGQESFQTKFGDESHAPSAAAEEAALQK